jgi:hypothetical protein
MFEGVLLRSSTEEPLYTLNPGAQGLIECARFCAFESALEQLNPTSYGCMRGRILVGAEMAPSHAVSCVGCVLGST